MKLTNKFLMAAVIGFLIISCTRSGRLDYQFESRNFAQKIVVVKSDSAKFELDSLTAPVVFSIHEVTLDGHRYLAYLNDETSTVFLNDMKTKKIVKAIHVEGDSVKNKKVYQGLLYHNKDSIFLFSYRPKVIMINESGKILKRFNLFNESDIAHKLFYNGFYVSTSLPAYYYRNRLFINSLVVGDIAKNEKRKVQMVLDLEKGKNSISSISFPKNNEGKKYGALHYQIFGMTYNSKLKQAVYSFPADKEVSITDLLTGNITSRPAESQYIKQFFEYDEENYKDAPSEPAGEFFMTTPTYGPVVYDKYRDVYYRLGLLPVDQKNANYEEKNPPSKLVSLIVLDNKFNYLGEQLLDKNRYWSSNLFVSKEGLNIQNRTKSDETLDFTTFTFHNK